MTKRARSAGSFGCYEAGPAPCLASANQYRRENLHTTYKGFKSRANITWHIFTGCARSTTPGRRASARAPSTGSSGCYVRGRCQ